MPGCPARSTISNVEPRAQPLHVLHLDRWKLIAFMARHLRPWGKAPDRNSRNHAFAGKVFLVEEKTLSIPRRKPVPLSIEAHRVRINLAPLIILQYERSHLDPKLIHVGPVLTTTPSGQILRAPARYRRGVHAHDHVEILVRALVRAAHRSNRRSADRMPFSQKKFVDADGVFG
jgi:hypothetical protein